MKNSEKKSNEMSDVEMLEGIRNDSHEVGKVCYNAFNTGTSIATGRLMCVAYNTAMRAMRDKKRYNVVKQ